MILFSSIISSSGLPSLSLLFLQSIEKHGLYIKLILFNITTKFPSAQLPSPAWRMTPAPPPPTHRVLPYPYQPQILIKTATNPTHLRTFPEQTPRSRNLRYRFPLAIIPAPLAPYFRVAFQPSPNPSPTSTNQL